MKDFTVIVSDAHPISLICNSVEVLSSSVIRIDGVAELDFYPAFIRKVSEVGSPVDIYHS